MIIFWFEHFKRPLVPTNIALRTHSHRNLKRRWGAYWKWCLIVSVLCASPLLAKAQCPVMPAGTICLTQAAANQAAANARELEATKEKVTVLEAGTDRKGQEHR
jgi:hypothetical protein